MRSTLGDVVEGALACAAAGETVRLATAPSHGRGPLPVHASEQLQPMQGSFAARRMPSSQCTLAALARPWSVTVGHCSANSSDQCWQHWS